MALDLTTFDAALKEHYTDDRVKNLVYRNNPMVALMPKMERFGGRNLPVPIQFANPMSRSVDYATALALKPGASSSHEAFLLTRARDYCLATIDNETMEASVGNANAFMEAAVTEINSAIHSCTRSLAMKLYRSGTGSVGQVDGAAYVAGTNQFTLLNPEDVVNYEVGGELVVSAGAGADGDPLRAGSATITAVDRDTGTITSDAAWDAQIAGFTNVSTEDDFIYYQGDAANGGPNVAITGLDAWLPQVVPAAAFFGVLRQQDASRLGGNFVNGTLLTVEEALIDGASRAAREGGRPSHVFMNHLHYAELLKSLGSKVQYERVSPGDAAVGEISFSGVRLHTPTGSVLVVPDHNCPTGNAYMLQLDTWKLYSLGMAPKILEPDGMRVLREPSLDALEVRVGYYAQLGCSAPGWNTRISLAT